jgi:hypothetical protein
MSTNSQKIPRRHPAHKKIDRMKKHILPGLLLGIGLSGCGDNIFGGKPERPPLPGDRISVLDYEKDLRPEEIE